MLLVQEDNQKNSKEQTTSLVINHNGITNDDYKPPMKRPPQNSFELKPYTSLTTISPNISTPRTMKIRTKSLKDSPKILPKEEVFHDERVNQQKKPKPIRTPVDSSRSQQTSGYKKADRCDQNYCTTPDCRCGGTDIPGIK